MLFPEPDEDEKERGVSETPADFASPPAFVPVVETPPSLVAAHAEPNPIVISTTAGNSERIVFLLKIYSYAHA
jgi:hypothetical protein